MGLSSYLNGSINCGPHNGILYGNGNGLCLHATIWRILTNVMVIKRADTKEYILFWVYFLVVEIYKNT